jgi:hypothetical protein
MPDADDVQNFRSSVPCPLPPLRSPRRRFLAFHAHIMAAGTLRLLVSFVGSDASSKLHSPLSALPCASIMAHRQAQSQATIQSTKTGSYWAQIITQPLWRLLYFADYPADVLAELCEFVNQVISPALGAAPLLDAAGRKTPAFESFMCDGEEPDPRRSSLPTRFSALTTQSFALILQIIRQSS